MGVLDSAGTINQDIVGATMIGVGLFVCFFGAKFFKYIVFFVGFCVGALLCYYAVPVFFKWFGVDLESNTLLYMTLSAGALCGILLVVIYKAAVFSCGAIGGAIFSQVVWIGVVANINTPEEDWMSGVQVGLMIVCAIAGGFLAFKFVEQVLKAVTAFIGGFMFASAIAYFIGRIDNDESGNVIDWVIFFGSYKNYNNLGAVCDEYCVVCILLWLALFAAGCFVQYKLHKKHKKKDHNDTDSDSDSSSDDESDDEDSDRSHKKGKKKRRKKRSGSDINDSIDYQSNQHREELNYYDPAAGSQYAGSQYGGRYAQSVASGTGSPEGPQRNNIAPSVAMSNYGANYYSGQPAGNPGTNQSMHYGGQRGQVQYV